MIKYLLLAFLLSSCSTTTKTYRCYRIIGPPLNAEAKTREEAEMEIVHLQFASKNAFLQSDSPGSISFIHCNEYSEKENWGSK